MTLRAFRAIGEMRSRNGRFRFYRKTVSGRHRPVDKGGSRPVAAVRTLAWGLDRKSHDSQLEVHGQKVKAIESAHYRAVAKTRGTLPWDTPWINRHSEALESSQ